MAEPFLGSAALASGRGTKAQLVTGRTRLYRDVYLANGMEITAIDRARAAWLWSRRRGVVAGCSAAAVHGSDCVSADRPAELLHDNRHRLPGLRVRGDALHPDEVEDIDGLPVTTPARTAVDLGCWYPTVEAVAGLDALVRAVKVNDVAVSAIVRRYAGQRGSASARASLSLSVAGSESQKESWLRVFLIQDRLPRPQTQIPVYVGYWKPFAVLDMGWPAVKVAAEYDGQ